MRRLDGSRRPSSRRSGRVRVAPPGVLRRGPELAGQPRLARTSSAGPRQHSREARLELGRGLVAVRATSALGDDRARCRGPASMRISDTPVSAIAGEDRGGDGRAPAMAGQQRRMQVQRAVAAAGPAAPAARSGRSRRARAGRAPAQRRRRRLPAAQALGGRSVGMPGSSAHRCTGVGVLPPLPSRSGRARVTTRHSSTSGCACEASTVGTAKAPLPKKTVARRRSVTRAAPAPPSSSSSAHRAAGRPGSARPSNRGSRCTACPPGGRARAAARAPGGRCRRP